MAAKISSAGIIDDDQIYQFVMKKTIEQSGLVNSVLQFYDGEEAITFFKEKREAIEALPELLLLDLNMPYMDGWQFLDEFTKLPLRSEYRYTIFIVTSSSTTEDMKRAKEYSIVTGYHIKPITKEKFVEMVQSILPAA